MSAIPHLGIVFPHRAGSVIRLKRKPARDPVVIAAEKAYHASNQYALDKLLVVEKRYAMRLGQAEAGLRKTRKAIRQLLLALAKDKLPDKFGKEVAL